jgi:hypothetical protein
MENIRYVNAYFNIVFSEQNSQNIEKYKKEFDILGLSDEDAVGEWLKLAKARGETGESDQVLLRLLVELHRKIDSLSAYVKGEQVEHISLENTSDVSGIGYGYFRVEKDFFEQDKEYYARVQMPIFPKREIPLFFQAISANEAKILLLHERDEKDWNAYLVARERAMIRELKSAHKDNEK